MWVNRWIEYHSQVSPNKEAVIDIGVGGRRITYAQLHQGGLDQAYRLQQKGIQKGERVALYMQNRVELLELMLGAGWLGASVVPLNTRLSWQELEKILGDSKPVLTILEPEIAPAALTGTPLDDFLGAPKGHPKLHEVSPRSALALFYTGGTTGSPKGAVLTHESMQWNAWNTINGWGLAPGDIAPIFTPMFHTGGLNVFSTPLLCLGATIILPGPFDPARALDLIRDEKCTLIFMVPTMYEMLRQVPGFGERKLEGVRKWISGGAPCPKPLLDFYWEKGLPLVQGYGLTEAGPNNFGISPEQARSRPASVGVPLPGVQLRLRKADGSEPGVNEAGELWVKGGHVMAGYLNHSPRAHVPPGLSADEVTVQFHEDGWLATGDLAMRDEEGFYSICGRQKEMFISGGENVFPAEIEETLLGHPSVSEVAVIGIAHAKWGEVGRAYIVVHQGHTFSEELLLAHCNERLARYKIPKEFILMESLPKSAAGKVLKRELQAPANR